MSWNQMCTEACSLFLGPIKVRTTSIFYQTFPLTSETPAIELVGANVEQQIQFSLWQKCLREKGVTLIRRLSLISSGSFSKIAIELQLWWFWL